MINISRNIRGSSTGVILASLATLTVVITLAFFSVMTWKTVEGNEVGVRETWSGGVDPNSLPPKTYWYNRWTESIYPYETSGQVFVMNDKTDAQEPFANGRHYDPLVVNSKDNQQVQFHIIVTWRIDPGHVVNLHKNYRNNIDERLIRPAVVNSMTVRATVQDAIDLYSGPRLVQLKKDVEDDLKDVNGQLLPNGVVVVSFVVEKPGFTNVDYVKTIEARQLAIAQESNQREQEKANLAKAAAAKAEAQINLNQQVVDAQAKKEVAILQQEATARMSIVQTEANAANAVTQQRADSAKVVLAAEAEAKRQIALSEAAKQSEINRSVGIKAVGEANAEANKLLLTSYSVPGADQYTRIQVAKELANSFSGVKGYLPNNMTMSFVAENYSKGLNMLVPTTPATAAFTEAK